MKIYLKIYCVFANMRERTPTSHKYVYAHIF